VWLTRLTHISSGYLPGIDSDYKVILSSLFSIEADGYIPKLLDLFGMCEDLENLESLHLMYSIFKTIFMLNKNALFEIMFQPENLMKVVGVMEYDPNKPEIVRHRDFLEKQVRE